jgi:hypothetical protein
MKVRIDIECTPDEARAFLGLPELGAVQGEIAEKIKAQMLHAVEAMDGEALMKAWFGVGAGEAMKGLGELQRAFWEQMARAASPSGAAPEEGCK